MTHDDLGAELSALPGTVSAYVGRLTGPPAYTRLADTPHYAASTMKVAVLAALYRAGEDGILDLDAPVPVRNDFASALPGAPRFSCAQDYDNDDAVWDRVGGSAPLRWLAERMIVRSSNLATNLVLAHLGLPLVAAAWARAGATRSVTARGIEDFAAREAGITNLVTAADLAALLGAIALGAASDTSPPPDPAAARDAAGAPGAVGAPGAAGLAGRDSCLGMLDVLAGQEHREDLAAGLPPGTRIAHKNGWVHGIRHGAGVVFPTDAPPYAVVVCTSVDLTDGARDPHAVDEEACRRIAGFSASVWAARHTLP